MYCSRRLYKGNSYDICLPLTDSGVTLARFYTAGDVVIEKVPEITGDSMCFSFTEEEIAYLHDGVLRYELVTEYETTDTNSPYVIVTPADYSGQTLDDLLEEAYDSGLTACSGGSCNLQTDYDYQLDGNNIKYWEQVHAYGLFSGDTYIGNTIVEPDSGYSGFENFHLWAWIPARDAEQAGFNSGYTSGYTDGYESGITSCPGFTPVTGTALHFNIISSGTICFKTTNSAYTKTIEYKLNDGDWTSITSSLEGADFNVRAGDTVFFRGNNSSYASGLSVYCSFSGSTAMFDVAGNIMSLIDIYYVNLYDFTDDYVFVSLFTHTNVHSAENLRLKATGLTEYCYRQMFQYCNNLVHAPALPATTLPKQCYAAMFSDCTRLKTAPQLPATSIAEYCYMNMFYGCSSLAYAPELPATTLYRNCYLNMFCGCSNLVAAPELPAPELVTECYQQMFMGCSKLHYVKCLATNPNSSSNISNWMNGTPSVGLFVKDRDTNWPTGVSGIRTGWTVVDANS